MKKKLLKRVLVAALAVCLTNAVTPSGVYASVGPGENPVRISDLKAAQEADHLILVAGDGGYEVTVSSYKKEQTGDWTRQFEVEGVYGKNGASSEKAEGDGKTPLGTYRFTMTFGILDDPGSILPYHKITKWDRWVDDSDSVYYNKLVDVREKNKDWNSAENMAASAPYYNYGLVLDYNQECVPGKGSAIFLHCMKSSADAGSSGCIRIPEEQVKALIQSSGEKSRIVIVSDLSQLEYIE